MVGVGHGRVTGQAALHVLLDPGQMPDQLLDIEVPQDVRRQSPSSSAHSSP